MRGGESASGAGGGGREKRAAGFSGVEGTATGVGTEVAGGGGKRGSWTADAGIEAAGDGKGIVGVDSWCSEKEDKGAVSGAPV